jgi:Spy/CpxP family protein refolding chaperone
MEQLGGFMRILGALDLTEEQRERIRTILDDARSRVRDIMEGTERTDQRGRMMELFVSESLTESELLDVMSQRDQVRDDIREIMAAALVDVHDVLTAEQLDRLAELLEERMGRGGPGGGAGFGPGPR